MRLFLTVLALAPFCSLGACARVKSPNGEQGKSQAVDQSQNVVRTPDPTQSKQSNQESLSSQTTKLFLFEERVKSLEAEVLKLKFDSYLQRMTDGLLAPAQVSADCEFAVSHWVEEQKTLKSFMDDSIRMTGSIDLRMQPAVRRYLYFLNKQCKSNLVWNP